MDTQPLESSTAQDVVENLAIGFVDNPFMSWIFPDEKTRPDALRAWFSCWANAYGDNALLFSASEGKGAALWAAPHGDALGDDGQAALVEAIRRWNDDRTALVIQGLMPLTKHPPQPYWYLNAIAIHSDARGHGLGAKLIEPMLNRADREGIPVYLESSDPRNLSFYFRYDFESWGEPIVMPEGGPSIQPMLRHTKSLHRPRDVSDT
jgi:GNAT superfamily N-acetyltransferase